MSCLISRVLSPLLTRTSAVTRSAYQGTGTLHPDHSTVDGTTVGRKRRAEELSQAGKKPSDRQHKRARALDSQGGGVKPMPVNPEAMFMASKKPQTVSQGSEHEEGPFMLEKSPESTPCRFRRPEGPLPEEESEGDHAG